MIQGKNPQFDDMVLPGDLLTWRHRVRYNLIIPTDRSSYKSYEQGYSWGSNCNQNWATFPKLSDRAHSEPQALNPIPKWLQTPAWTSFSVASPLKLLVINASASE